MAVSRKIEVDKGAVLAIPQGDTRSIDIKAGAVVIVYPETWTAEQVLAMIAALKPTTT